MIYRDAESESLKDALKAPSSVAIQNSSSKLSLKFKSPMQTGSGSHNSLRKPSNNLPSSSKYFSSSLSQSFSLSSTPKTSVKRSVDELEFIPTSTPQRSSISHDTTTVKRPRLNSDKQLQDVLTPPTRCGDEPGSENQPYSHFICLYRKTHGLAPKKNITWDGDGYLTLFKSQRGEMAVLKDANSGKMLGNVLLGLKFNMTPGVKLKLASREIEIQRRATESEILNLERSAKKHEEADWSEIVKNARLELKNPIKAVSSSARRSGGPMYDPKAPGAVVLTRPDSNWLKINNQKNLEVLDVVVDPLISKALRPHQIDGVNFMYECVMGMREIGGNGCILADEMGLGKSLQAIALLWTLIRQSPIAGQDPFVKRAIIVCPVTLVKNWAREINKWLGRSRLNVFVADGKIPIRHFTSGSTYKVLIIGYEKLRLLAKEINSAYPPVGLIIADEGHRLKSVEAKTTKALRTLKTQRRVVLSGTPIQNNLTEYYAMVDFVNPGILGDYRSFKKIFEQPILKSREPSCSIGQKALGETRAEELAQLSKNYVLRRGSEMMAQHLPPRHDYCVFISLTEVQRKIYEAILDSQEIREVFSGDVSQHLVLINTLKKLCNSPGLLMDEKSIKSLSEISSSLLPAWVTRDDVELSGKLIALAEFLSVLRKKNEEKIIVVSNYTKTLDIIETHCRVKRYSFCRLDGKTPQNQRDTIVQSFNRSSPSAQFVFLLSSKSGGVGLNLIGASRLILFDGDWNPATDLQAMARIWRQGQQRPCHIYRFLLTGTIDECVFQRQVTKMGLATDLISDSKKEGDDFSGGGNTFTKDELRKLFELYSDTSCHTHDLLACRCLDQVGQGVEPEIEIIEVDDEGDSDSDEVEELPDFDQIGFLPATQYNPSISQGGKKSKTQKKLAELETWLHIDPTKENNVSKGDQEFFLKKTEDEEEEEGDLEEDLIEDDILNEIVYGQRQRQKFRLGSTNGKGKDDLDGRDDDDDDVVIVNREDSSQRKVLSEGGTVTFIFRKTNTVV
ncbi:SNF2 family N-terminal domain-containing protein [Phakopsora pachyrhizi]|nr:SNF2 family N-terminal domain-containing protein [Phakopsora pachyrhizi]